MQMDVLEHLQYCLITAVVSTSALDSVECFDNVVSNHIQYRSKTLIGKKGCSKYAKFETYTKVKQDNF